MIPDPQARPLARPATASGASAPGAEVPLKDVLVELWQNIEKLLRQEVALARTEIETKAHKLQAHLVGSAAGAVLVLCSVLSLVATIILLLSEVMRPWLAALITSGVTAAVGYALLKKASPRAADVTPERTIENVKKDLQTFREAGK
jgi:hypothetical protein